MKEKQLSHVPRRIEKEEKSEEYRKLDEIIREFKGKEGTLITVLHQAQHIFGYLPRPVLVYISEEMGIPFAEVYGVVSFYSLFSMKPRGKYTIEVCMGTACYVKGSQQILDSLKEKLQIEPGEVTEDGLFTIETTRCKGACSLAPVVGVGEDIHSRVTTDQIEEILEGYRKQEDKT
ncbi:MAG: NAD(P)H-dependent oxidoreductase subunit E [Bacillota bacterium]